MKSKHEIKNTVQMNVYSLYVVMINIEQLIENDFKF